MIFINYKTYEQGTGQKGLELAKAIDALSKEIGVPITILAQTADLRLLSSNVSLNIWAQHIDNLDYGKNTGWLLPEASIQAGAQGTMINHAEHKMPLVDVTNITIKYSSANFQVLVSTTSLEEALIMDQLKPSYIAYEPQEYIGTRMSVVDVAPDAIRNLSSKIHSNLVIGAGIHTPQHIKDGFALGVSSFLISSDIMLSNSPMDRVKEYMLAYKDAYNTFN